MQNLSQSVSKFLLKLKKPQQRLSINSELKRLEDLIDAGEAAEAFFLARSLFTSGEEWAEEWMKRLKQCSRHL